MCFFYSYTIFNYPQLCLSSPKMKEVVKNKFCFDRFEATMEDKKRHDLILREEHEVKWNKTKCKKCWDLREREKPNPNPDHSLSFSIHYRYPLTDLCNISGLKSSDLNLLQFKSRNPKISKERKDWWIVGVQRKSNF